jgi:diguanylate cyclase (GGDEF)-like protein
MYLFGWLDLRTLVACQIPLAVVFALALYAVRRIYPHLRGVELLAIGFALWVPAIALTVAQGAIPALASVATGSILTIAGYVLLYRGVLVFFESKGILSLVYDATSVAAAVILYFTVVHDLAFPRIIAVSLIAALVRGLIAVELLSKAKGRTPVFLFASFLILFAILPLAIALVAIFNGAALAHSGLEAFDALANLAFLSGCGLLSLTLFIDEASRNAEQSAQYDFLTGTLSRRAIEETLSVEIARSGRTHSPVSVMMIEIDYLHALTGIHGREKMDKTVCTVVSTIGNMLRFYDKCGRLADDKFLVVLPENVAEHALVIASRFREALKSPSLPHDQPAVTLSIGITQSTFKEFTEDVLARAEKALIEARNKGRDCAHLAFDSHQHLHVAEVGAMNRLAARTRVPAKAR